MSLDLLEIYETLMNLDPSYGRIGKNADNRCQSGTVGYRMLNQASVNVCNICARRVDLVLTELTMLYTLVLLSCN